MSTVLQQIRARRLFMASRPRPQKRLPRQLQPDGVRLEYRRELLELMERARGLVQVELFPLIPELVRQLDADRGDTRADALPPGKRVNTLMDRVSAEFYERIMTPRVLENTAQKFGERTSKFQREQLNKQVRAAVGVDVIGAEPKLAPRIEQFTARNVALIKSVPQKYFDDIEKRLLAGLSEGKRASELADELEERFGVAESDATRIANDQIGKLYGELNQVRQEALGVTGYIWRTVNDNRVREEHADREGEHFEWDDPPAEDAYDGHPGTPINCRCWAEPDLSDLLESL